MTITRYPFTEAEAEEANQKWHANCGPNALAFAMGMKLEDVRQHIPQFDERRYTSPTMMKAALQSIGQRIGIVSFLRDAHGVMFHPEKMSLIRIQWTGPWTVEGANPKWAYRQTHWIASWRDGPHELIFDCNGGIMEFWRWKKEIVPMLTELYPRADGGWFPTHIWRLVGEA